MNKKAMLGIVVLATTLSAAGAGVGFAEGNGNGNDAAEAKALIAAKVTIAQAVQAAESNAGGHAMSVDFTGESGQGSSFYVVELIAQDGSREDLAVDATTGAVSKVVHDDQGDGEGGENPGENGQD